MGMPRPGLLAYTNGTLVWPRLRPRAGRLFLSCPGQLDSLAGRNAGIPQSLPCTTASLTWYGHRPTPNAIGDVSITDVALLVSA